MRKLCGKSVDLVSAMKQSERRTRVKARQLYTLSLLAWMLFFLCMYIYGWLNLWNTQKQREELKEQAAVLKNEEGWNDLLDQRKTIVGMQARRQTEEALHTLLEKLHHFDGTCIRLLRESGQGQIQIEAIDYNYGQMDFIGRTSDYRQISAYVETLKSSGLFEDIQYLGFEIILNSGDQMYQFQISGKWKPNAG